MLAVWVCCPNQYGVAGSKFGLEQGGFEIGMPSGISSRSERSSRTKITPAQRVAAAWTSRSVSNAGKAFKDSPALAALRRRSTELATTHILFWATDPNTSTSM